jgi:hypothetical protein
LITSPCQFQCVIDSFISRPGIQQKREKEGAQSG